MIHLLSLASIVNKDLLCWQYAHRQTIDSRYLLAIDDFLSGGWEHWGDGRDGGDGGDGRDGGHVEWKCGPRPKRELEPPTAHSIPQFKVTACPSCPTSSRSSFPATLAFSSLFVGNAKLCLFLSIWRVTPINCSPGNLNAPTPKFEPVFGPSKHFQAIWWLSNGI